MTDTEYIECVAKGIAILKDEDFDQTLEVVTCLLNYFAGTDALDAVETHRLLTALVDQVYTDYRQTLRNNVS